MESHRHHRPPPAHVIMMVLVAVTYGIAGCAAQAISAASQQMFDFGPVGIGSSSDPQTITLANFGNDATLALISIKAKPGFAKNQFTITGGTCKTLPGPLQTTKTCTLIVQVMPTVTGTVQGLVTVTATDDIDGIFTSQPVLLTATGVAPQLTMTPTLDFGNVPLGTKSPAQSFFLINSGNVTANLAPFQITILPSLGATTPQLTATGGTCTTTSSLAPRETCTFIIKAVPTVAGQSLQEFVLLGPRGSGYSPVTNWLTVNSVPPILAPSPTFRLSPLLPVQPTLTPAPSPNPSPNPTPASTPSATPSPSPIASPSAAPAAAPFLAPTPSPSPTAPTPASSPAPSPSPSPRQHRHHLGK